MTQESLSGNQTSFYGPFNSVKGATDEAVRSVLPIGGTVSNLTVNIKTPTGNSGKEWKFTIKKAPAAGGASVATALTCGIKEAAVACTSAAAVPFAAGEQLSLEDVSNGNPVAWGNMRWAVTLTP
jgi:hypothetical protein